MATLYLDASGIAKVVSVGLIPGGTEPPHAAVFEYDETTNPVLHTAALNNTPGDIVVQNGVVRWKGSIIPVVADSEVAIRKRQLEQDRQQVEQAMGALDTLIDASGAGNLTAAQQQNALKLLLRVARYLLRSLVRR